MVAESESIDKIFEEEHKHCIPKYPPLFPVTLQNFLDNTIVPLDSSQACHMYKSNIEHKTHAI